MRPGCAREKTGMWQRWYRCVVRCVFLCGLLTGGANLVAAHAEYRDSVPANGARVVQPPAQVSITFSQETSPTQSRGRVTDAMGATVSTGARVPLDDRTRLLIDLQPNLPNGLYTVQWTSQSADMHNIDGSFVFTVGAAASTGAPWGLWAAVFAGGSLVVAVGLLAARRATRVATPVTGAARETD